MSKSPCRPWLRRLSLNLAVLLCLGLAALAVRPALAFETAAREALLIDADTGAVLLDKGADTSMPPASMSKTMTIYLIMEALKDGRLTLDTKLPVSEKAWRMGGSKMFVEVGKEVRVEDLLRGVVVQSGNDACIVLAEGLAGSEEGFVTLMNQKAQQLGLTGSTFANVTGWPHPDHRMTPRDLATLALRTIQDFPEYYPYYAEKVFVWSEIKQGNRNPLLYKKMGADGLKTGHTEEAGYGLTGSALQNGRRLIMVLSGMNSMKQRAAESQRVMRWGFREFANYALYKAGDKAGEAEVWQGEAATVPLVLSEDLTITLPRKSRSGMKVAIAFDGPLPAPITAGDRVARLTITAPDSAPVEVPLLAGADVPQLGIFGRFMANVRHMVFGEP